MAKKEFRYFKLGEKASTFVDPKSGVQIVNDQVVKHEAAKCANSKSLQNAIEGGHIKELSEEEYQEALEGVEEEVGNEEGGEHMDEKETAAERKARRKAEKAAKKNKG